MQEDQSRKEKLPLAMLLICVSNLLQMIWSFVSYTMYFGIDTAITLSLRSLILYLINFVLYGYWYGVMKRFCKVQTFA